MFKRWLIILVMAAAVLPLAARADYLLLKGGYIVKTVNLVGDKDGVTLFYIEGGDRLYRIKSELVIQRQAIEPAAAAELKPAELDQYIADNGEMSPTHPVAAAGPVKQTEATEGYDSRSCATCNVRGDGWDDVVPRLGRTIYLFGNLGYNHYRMDDVNQFISDQNQANNLTLDSINSGGGSSFGGGFWLTDNLALGFEIGSLYAAASSRNGDFRETLNLPAVESGIFARVGKRFWNHLILSVGGGIYGLNLAGASLVDYNRALSPYAYSVTRIYGYTYATKAFGSAEVMLAPHVGLGLDVGYRWADIENQRIRMDGQRSTLLNPDGSSLDVDYSGLFVNTGLRFYFH